MILFFLLLPKCCSSTMQVTSKNPKKRGDNRSLFCTIFWGQLCREGIYTCLPHLSRYTRPPKCAWLINIHILWQRWRDHKKAKKKQQVCVCVLFKKTKQKQGYCLGNIPDKWSRFSLVTCLSNQHKGFMVRSYNERLHWEYETLILLVLVTTPETPPTPKTPLNFTILS